jgi:serine/threonine-protein kinase
MYGLGVGPDGKPYYVMRLIRGKTLQQAVDELFSNDSNKDREVERRKLHHLLRQFMTVCQTVAYAHTRGIIHRDLKPANVVLGDYGETFVVDWGLAKAVTSGEPITNHDDSSGQLASIGASNQSLATTAPRTLPAAIQTEVGRMLGTPGFMSPEQSAGRWDQLTPASDIYSLGAVLFSILTGRPPADSPLNADTGKRIGPRKLKPAVPAALDAVCVKALAHDPNDRYASATDLAADVERWLADEPVTAWKEPWPTRCGRWVRRHRSWVTAAAVLMVTAVIGLAAGLFFVERERRETVAQRQRTQTALDESALQRQRTREALDEMTSGATSDWLATQKALLPQQKQFLERALAYYQEFAKESADDQAGRVLLAKARFRVASMLDRLGRNVDAEPYYRDAVAVWKSLCDECPTASEYRRDLAASHNNLGTMLSRQGKKADAATAYNAAIAIREILVRDEPAAAEYQNDLAASYNNLALLHNSMGNKVDAEAAFRKAIAVHDQLAANFPNADYRSQQAQCINGLAVLLKQLQRNDEAESSSNRAIEIQKALVTQFPELPEHRAALAAYHNNFGNVMTNLGRPTDAAAAYRQALEVQEQLVTDFPALPQYRDSLAKSYNNFAIASINLGKLADAELAYRRAISIHEKLATDFPKTPDHQREWALGLHNLSLLLTRIGKKSDAEAGYRRAVGILEPLVAAYPTSVDYRIRLADSSINVGLTLKDRGEPQEAIEYLTRGIDLFVPIVSQDAKLIREKKRLCVGYEVRAAALHKLQRFPEAVADWDKAIVIEGPTARSTLHIGRGLSLERNGDHTAAIAAAESAVKTPTAPPADLFHAARIIALAANAMKDDAAEVERLGRRSVELLREAVGRGYKDTKNWNANPDLAILRDRDDFQKLLAEMEK